VQTLDDLHSWKVSVLAQTGLSFDLSTASGKLMRTIMAGLTEFERDLIREPTDSLDAIDFLAALTECLRRKVAGSHRAVREARMAARGLGSWMRPVEAMERHRPSRPVECVASVQHAV